jgi:biliverdin reductase
VLRIAVIGAGRAGNARIRAIEDSPQTELAGVVRRSGEPELADVLADPAVDAVLICTPNAQHDQQVEAGLRAHKHVGVEFPLASSPERARGLFDLAEQKERVLHVEHIELLSASQQVQRQSVSGLGRPTGGRLSFSGAAEGWIGDPTQAGSQPLRALARLHRLVDLFGPAEIAAASLTADATRYRLSLRLDFERGGSTELVEERGPGLARRTEWDIACERGVLGAPDLPPPAGRGLFAEDLDVLVGRIGGTAEPYVSRARVVEVLELVAQAERRLASAP